MGSEIAHLDFVLFKDDKLYKLISSEAEKHVVSLSAVVVHSLRKYFNLL